MYKWQQTRKTPAVCGAAIKTFIAEICTLLHDYYFPKGAMKIVHSEAAVQRCS